MLHSSNNCCCEFGCCNINFIGAGKSLNEVIGIVESRLGMSSRYSAPINAPSSNDPNTFSHGLTSAQIMISDTIKYVTGILFNNRQWFFKSCFMYLSKSNVERIKAEDKASNCNTQRIHTINYKDVMASAFDSVLFSSPGFYQGKVIITCPDEEIRMFPYYFIDVLVWGAARELSFNLRGSSTDVRMLEDKYRMSYSSACKSDATNAKTGAIKNNGFKDHSGVRRLGYGCGCWN